MRWPKGGFDGRGGNVFESVPMSRFHFFAFFFYFSRMLAEGIG